jgi:hypothetical protein
MPPTAEQNELIASLARRSEKVARIYDGGLGVFYQAENAGRLPLTAHSMRELMAKCPILTGREPTPQGDTVNNRIGRVKEAYLELKKQGYNEASPLDATEGAMRTLFAKLDKFFEWMEDNRPQLEKRTAEMLSDLSGPGQALPMDIFDAEVARWLAANNYFTRIAHHGQDHINENEFMVHMTFIENVLLQRLRPRAIADHNAIDALVAEVEHGH